MAFTPVLLAEMLAFLALFNRRMLALWGLVLIGMHWGIEIVMKLHFAYNQQILWIFWVNVPFWIWAVAKSRSRPVSSGA